jgi:immune inhibitor InhA-like protein
MRRPLKPVLGALTALATVTAMSGLVASSASAASSGDPGDPTIVLDLNDSSAGGSYEETFKRVYAGVAPSGTPVYVYVPNAYTLGSVPTDVRSMDPTYDWNPADDSTPCAESSASDYVLTQAQINYLGNELTNHILAVDESHFGQIGLADPTDADSDALVMIVYDIHDDNMYDCAATSYTAGQFAPGYIDDAGMNVIAVDAFDWANRIGDQSANPDGQSELYEGVIAHELEHLLHNYSDAGELSWVDEGLADFAVFLNGYDIGGSHLTNHQVLHRETSLTRWAGGLANYGAAFTYFLYLWEQAGGNGAGDHNGAAAGLGTYDPDFQYDAQAGDLLIKLIFQNQADGMAGVQAAIDAYNAQTSGPDLRSAKALFKDWALAVYADTDTGSILDLRNIDFGDPDFTSWTIDIANDEFWKKRGQYNGATPEGRFQHSPKVPAQSALPFGVSYETFRNPGPTFRLDFTAPATSRVVPHSEPNHWYAGYASQSDHVLAVDSPVSGGQVLDFWTWYFIEDGWDYGFVEALVGGQWVTVPLTNDAGATVTTNTNPHDNNTEGNGLTGTSGGTYFVDDPTYIHLQATLPAGATDVRFRYSTDAAYLDTGWFVDDVRVAGAPATVASESGWFLSDGTQNNDWSVQLLSKCDLTPGTTIQGETFVQSDGYYVYRLSGAQISQQFTKCSTQDSFTAVISNLPTGDLDVLDAPYTFRITNTGAKGQKG